MSEVSAPELPPVFCPIESTLHPEVDLVEKHSIGWLTATGLSEGETGRAWLAGTNAAEFYARITPRADVDRLKIASDWCYWGFSFDDALCDTDLANRGEAPFIDIANRLQRRLEAPTYRPTGDDVHLTALTDLADRFRRCATPTQFRRWTEAHRGWLSATAWQLANAERDRTPNLADYLAMRLNSCAGEPTTAMIEIVNGAEVPAHEMDSPRVRALTEITRMVAALDNDLVSFRKEVRDGQAGQNIITVLTDNGSRTLQQALHRSIEIRDRIMVLFLRLREAASVGAGHELRHYLTDLGHVIRGNLEWSLRVPRYNSAGPLTAPPVAPGTAFPGWADRPSSANTDPLPIPAITWWWEQVA